MLFCVMEDKFLGYMITKEGMKPHPKKVEAIINMKTPKTIKVAQRLDGSIVVLNRFLANSKNKCKPFYDLLRTSKKNVECKNSRDEAFNKVKSVLTQLPTLHSPSEGETLTMYIASFSMAVSMVLLSKTTGQQPIILLLKSPSRSREKILSNQKIVISSGTKWETHEMGNSGQQA